MKKTKVLKFEINSNIYCFDLKTGMGFKISHVGQFNWLGKFSSLEEFAQSVKLDLNSAILAEF